MANKPEDGVWSLEMETHDSTISMLGSNEVLSAAIREWKDWAASDPPDELAILEVHGYQNEIAKGEVQIVILMERIVGMSLRRVHL